MLCVSHFEHRFCVWHLHVKFKARYYIEKAFKDELWGVTRVGSIYAFDHHMQKILSMNKSGYAYFSSVFKTSGYRHAFNC
jgi:hypothetical protein